MVHSPFPKKARTRYLSLMRKATTLFLTFMLFMLSYWLTSCGQAPPPPPPTPTLSPEAVQGKSIFSRECGSCHSLIADTIIVGPSLYKVAERATERVPEQDARTYLLTSILAPNRYLVEGYQDLMPATFGKRLSGEDVDALVAFLLTLD